MHGSTRRGIRVKGSGFEVSAFRASGSGFLGFRVRTRNVLPETNLLKKPEKP